MEEFFRYVNQREPPSLSNQGSLRSGNKSDILDCLKAPSQLSQLLLKRPQLLYLTWQHRGLGQRTRIGDGHTRIPKQDWNTVFLKNSDNKRELFPFLSAQLVKQDLGGRLILSTSIERVLSNKQHDVSGLEPCNHAEADTRILLHLAHASQQGHQVALVRTVDSDVVILAVHCFASLGLSELWVCLGSGRKCVIFRFTLTLPSWDHQRVWLCLYFMRSQAVTQSHNSCDVAKRQLGQPGRAPQD